MKNVGKYKKLCKAKASLSGINNYGLLFIQETTGEFFFHSKL